MQVAERVVYRGRDYALAGHKGSRRDLLDAEDHGFRPADLITAWHRGYVREAADRHDWPIGSMTLATSA